MQVFDIDIATVTSTLQAAGWTITTEEYEAERVRIVAGKDGKEITAGAPRALNGDDLEVSMLCSCDGEQVHEYDLSQGPAGLAAWVAAV